MRPKNHKTETVGIRLTLTDRQKLEGHAEAEGLSVSDFLRELVERYEAGELRQLDSKTIDDLVDLLSRQVRVILLRALKENK